MRFSVVLCALACVCLAHAAQVFSTAELFARAAAEASTLGLSAEDVMTSQDFSAAEFSALQTMSKDEFWSHLESELANTDERMNSALNQHSFIEDPKAAAAPKKVIAKKPAAKKADAKKTDSKAASAAIPALLTDADLKVGKASGKSPVEAKEPALPDKDYENDDPYTFVYADHAIPTPEKTDAVLARGAKIIKKLHKQVKDQGKILMNEVVRAERNGKKAVAEGDFIEVKKLAKQARKLMKQVKKWNFKKNTLKALKATSSQVIDFEAAEHARVAQLKKSYVASTAERAKELHELANAYITDGQMDRVDQLKAKAMKALNKDLAGLKKNAMNNFVLKLREVLYKKFGQAPVDAAVKKNGLVALKQLTGDKSGEVLLAVAAHLPTVGPYVRAGLVPKEAGNTAFKFVRRW